MLPKEVLSPHPWWIFPMRKLYIKKITFQISCFYCTVVNFNYMFVYITYLSFMPRLVTRRTPSMSLTIYVSTICPMVICRFFMSCNMLNLIETTYLISLSIWSHLPIPILNGMGIDMVYVYWNLENHHLLICYGRCWGWGPNWLGLVSSIFIIDLWDTLYSLRWLYKIPLFWYMYFDIEPLCKLHLESYGNF